jgi:hypothetical protein
MLDGFSVKLNVTNSAKMTPSDKSVSFGALFNESSFESWLNENREPMEAVHNSYMQKFGYGTALKNLDYGAFHQEYCDNLAELIDAGELAETEEGEYCYVS